MVKAPAKLVSMFYTVRKDAPDQRNAAAINQASSLRGHRSRPTA